MDKIQNLIDAIYTTKLTEIGDVYLFGSFIKTNATAYNDIDIFIDVEPSKNTLNKIKGKLNELPFKLGRLGPQYYSPGPTPPARPPFPNPFPKPPKPVWNDVLHVTVCKLESARIQPFFETLITGKHLKLANAMKKKAA